MKENKMNYTRREQFRAWLIAGGDGHCTARPDSIHTYITDLEDRVEIRLQLTLDAEFDRDGLVSLHNRFDTNNNDAESIEQLLIDMELPTADTSTLSSYGGSINHYKRFCETFYPRQAG